MDAHDGPVIIGYDGGSGAADALRLGIGWASELGTPAIVVTVYPGPAPISPGRVDAEWVADRRAEAEHLLDEARRLGATNEVEFRALGSGSASHGLHDVAEELEASLIVLGSPQRQQPPLLTATTGDRVIAGAPCPVSIPPNGWRDRPARELRRIGVAFVPTPDGREALRTAAVFGRGVNAQLHVVTVVAEEAEVMSYRIGQDAEQRYVSAAQQEFQRSIEDAIAELAPDLTAFGEVIVGGDVVKTLADLRDTSFDALFMGSRGYGPIRSVLLGGVSARLMRQLEVPAVVVPRPG